MGEEASISHHVDCYAVDRLVIGNHATVSQYAILCTASHDISDPNMKLISTPVIIESQSWVCTGAFVCPGVIVREGAVVGAMSVVTKDVPAWTVQAGNPARHIKKRELAVIGNQTSESQNTLGRNIAAGSAAAESLTKTISELQP